MRSYKRAVTVIALIAHTSSLHAQVSPACYTRLNAQSLIWTEILNRENGVPLVPTPRLTFRVQEDPTVPFMNEAPLISGFVIRIFEEITRQAAVNLAEYFWVVTNERMSEGMSNATERQIESFVANGMTNTHSSTTEREALRLIARDAVAELKRSRVPRQTIAQTTEELKINLAGLEDIRKSVLEGKSGIEDYKSHLNYIMSTASGRLLTVRPFSASAKHLLRATAEEMKTPIDIHVDESRVKWAMSLFYNQFRADWASSVSAWKSARAKFEHEINVPEGQADPYFWLTRFIESAPQAVVATIARYPGYRSHLCWMLGQVDRRLWSANWDKSVGGIWPTIWLPLWVAGVAVIPVLMAGAPLAIMFGGIMVLQAASAVDMYSKYLSILDVSRRQAYTRAMMVSGMGSESSIDLMAAYNGEIDRLAAEIGIAAAIEVASLAFAKGLSVMTLRSVRAMSRTQLADRLYATMTGVGRRKSFAAGELKSIIERKLSREAYLESLYANGGRIDRRVTDQNWIRQAVSTMSQKEVDELLVGTREFGFGRSLFLTEAGVAFAGQGYSVLNSGLFDEFKPWDYVIPTFMPEN